ncbi:MAG: damage-control phosphatase ARMT1 family protein [Deltaproteobacteria bacterium]|nr:damage-control phosphatase ARMT1 family protein [Deltaproteobacteria bacterium]
MLYEPAEPLQPETASIPKSEEDPLADAWLTNFFTENHLDFETQPDEVASPEQVRFVVHLPENAVYYPCSTELFEAILKRQSKTYLQDRYQEVWKIVEQLVQDLIADESRRTFLTELLRIKFEHDTNDDILLPSRLEKRLFKIFIDKSKIDTPYFPAKVQRNKMVNELVAGPTFWNSFNWIDHQTILSFESLEDLKSEAAKLQLRRLLNLCVASELWETGEAGAGPSRVDFNKILHRPLGGNGVKPLQDYLQRPQEAPGTCSKPPKKILWLCNDAGEIVVDLKIIRFLLGWGHKVILVVKDGFYLHKVSRYDVEHDPLLMQEVHDAYHIKDPAISKNELLERLKTDTQLFIISDGTQERLNFLLTSTTFARMFKEADMVISKGEEQWRRLFFTPFQFTRDIFNVRLGPDGQEVIVSYKPKHPEAVKFSEQDLKEKANGIIREMTAAKDRGDKVIFYSAIIGSIPGQMETAVQLLKVYVDHLRKGYQKSFIINPAEHFVSGMDADDLMYMWEVVQRSGLIDIWRFQTVEDIETSFGLLNREVAPEWLGKDATYSTGCTKEMKLAMEVQRKHPEMQIIGPAKERFLRRSEYGIGKLYDRQLSDISLP